MRELAIAQDIDPDSLVVDVSEAQIFADIERIKMSTRSKPTTSIP